MKRRLLKVLFVIVATGAAAVAALLIRLWTEHDNELTLPTPTGAFAVGRVTEVWSDDTRADLFAEAPNTKQELVVWMWYPSTSPRTAKAADYLPSF